MRVGGIYLYDIGKLADKLTREFGRLSYEKFAQDAGKIESAIVRLLIMKEGWTWLPRKVRQELVQINWRAVTGRWDWHTGRHVGLDVRQLWETIVQKLPQVRNKVEELLSDRS